MLTARTLTIVLLAACLFASPVRAVELTDALRELLERAEAGLADGELELAESRYRVALLETWMQLALLQTASGDLPAARDALLESTRSAAVGERRTRSSLALVQLWLGQTDEALAHLRDLATRHPKNTQIRQLFAQALLASGRAGEAARQLDDMRARMPKVVEAIERHAEAFEARRIGEGEAAGEQARREAFLPVPGGGAFQGLAAGDIEAEKTRIRATQARIYRNLAVLERGHPACAEGLLARAAEVEERTEAAKQAAYGTLDLRAEQLVPIQPLRVDVTALWQNARVEHLPVMRRIEAGELRAAEKQLRGMLDQSDDRVARDMLGVLLAGRGRIAEAREQFAAVAAAAPDFLPARQHLVRLDLLAEDADREAVHVELRAIAELGPMERDLELELADAELASGEVAAARKRFVDAADRFSSPRAYLRLIDLLVEQAEVEESVRHAIRAMRLAPSSAEVLAAYARAAHQADRAGDALGAVEPLVRLHPGVAEYHFLHGMAVLDRGNPVAARAALETALELDPALAEGYGELSVVCAQLGDRPCSERQLDLYRQALRQAADAGRGVSP